MYVYVVPVGKGPIIALPLKYPAHILYLDEPKRNLNHLLSRHGCPHTTRIPVMKQIFSKAPLVSNYVELSMNPLPQRAR